MTKIDLAKTDKHYYDAPREPVLRTYDSYNYVTATGFGAPLGDAYSEAVSSLYRAAYGAKKLAKAAGDDFVVPKLEGLWWVESDAPPLTVPRDQWHWKMMIRMPEVVSADMVGDVVFESLTEGAAIQVMYLGPYADEPETLARMDAFMAARNLTMNGRHHEIYLSDPTKSKPETMRTILRHPVR
ncbi:GyrI-like domain-containing protein [Nocardia crassostreae]|uniref:GyrI-like domain-containing protein n=1 Tax=Nocardia crassostreae TaxID=53428 RepID=UPI0008305C57|nr:GyrI-like domain-containing protein [Nocardia crassostreae]